MLHRQPSAKLNHWKPEITVTSFQALLAAYQTMQPDQFPLNMQAYSPKRQPIGLNFAPCRVTYMVPSLAG